MLDEISPLVTPLVVIDLMVITVGCGSDIYLRALMRWLVPVLRSSRSISVSCERRPCSEVSRAVAHRSVLGVLTVNAVLTCIDKCCARWDLVVWGVVFFAARR